MPDSSANLALPYIQPAQAQKHVTHNEAIRRLDAIVQMSVVSRSQAAAPANPVEGQRHIVPAGGSGAFAGQGGRIAVWHDTVWEFLTPAAGWIAWVEAEGALVVHDGSGWQPLQSADLTVTMLGVNATPDPVNRLVSSADATLLTHDGADHRLVLNKAGAVDTASLVFQSGWTGHAEMGLAGGTGFSIKTSADGSSWAEALQVAGDGVARFPCGATVDGPLGGTGVVGAIGAGAVLEHRRDAQGDVLRLADGTMICLGPVLDPGPVTTARGALFASADLVWTFPEPFIAAPVVSGQAGPDGWLAIAPASAVSAALRVLAPISLGTGPGVRLMAVGRWI